MSVISRIAPHVAHDERGFTLIEVLVAILTGLVALLLYIYARG